MLVDQNVSVPLGLPVLQIIVNRPHVQPQDNVLMDKCVPRTLTAECVSVSNTVLTYTMWDTKQSVT